MLSVTLSRSGQSNSVPRLPPLASSVVAFFATFCHVRGKTWHFVHGSGLLAEP